ncbi:MAG: hypothetical protein HY079_09000, partial [Elusimicrobia bacterium]|nr:hypothetical protein [Elusimicrobiota bacterium]
MGMHDDAFLLDAHDGLDRLDRLLEGVEDGGARSAASAAEAAEVCRGLFEAASQLSHGRFAAPAFHLLAELEGLKAAGGAVP